MTDKHKHRWYIKDHRDGKILCSKCGEGLKILKIDVDKK